MLKKKQLKVIIDTNLWISFLVGKKLASLKPLLVEVFFISVLEEILDQELLIDQAMSLIGVN